MHGTQYPLSSTAVEEANAETWAADESLTWTQFGGGVERSDDLPNGISNLRAEMEEAADASGAVSPPPSSKYKASSPNREKRS